MPNEKVTVLKAKQDALDVRKGKLLAKFMLFRDALIRELELFIEDALNNGLRSVRKLSRLKNSKELAQIEFGLNDMELVMISNDDVYDQNPMMEDLAAKIFVYESGDDDHTPLMEVAFVESVNEEYRIQAQWFLQSGASPLLDIKLSEESGSKMASTIVHHIYRFQFSWRDKPTMKAALGKGPKRSFGFVKE